MKNKSEKHFEVAQDSGKRFLLVLDNCHDLFEKKLESVKTLLSTFSDKCEHIKILVVTRNTVNSFNNVSLKKID